MTPDLKILLVSVLAPTQLLISLMRLELAYGLRYAELNNRDPNRPWSIRQTAIYHKFKASSMASTWVLIAASRRAELSIDRYIKSCVDMAALNPFEIHLIVLDTALANWRPYIVSLTERITQQVCLCVPMAFQINT